MAKMLYTAEAHVTGGRREGHGETTSGSVEVDLRMPPELGGEGGGTNPEELFAMGYAACFESAVTTVARRMKVDTGGTSVDSRVSVMTGGGRSFKLEWSWTSTCRASKLTPARRWSSCAQPTRSAPTRTPRAATSAWRSRPTDTPWIEAFGRPPRIAVLQLSRAKVGQGVET